MIVVAIIAILSTIGSMAYIISRDKARASACMMTMDTIKAGLEQYVGDYTFYPDSSAITSFADAKAVLKGSVEFSTNTTCEDPLIYVSGKTNYKMETRVHFTGAPGLGVKIILENGEMHQEDLKI